MASFVDVARPRPEADGVEGAEEGHQQAPPEGWVKVVEHGGRFVMTEPLPCAVGQQHQPVDQRQTSDEEPDGEQLAASCSLSHNRYLRALGAMQLV